jgi:hypothetical protein
MTKTRAPKPKAPTKTACGAASAADCKQWPASGWCVDCTPRGLYERFRAGDVSLNWIGPRK